MLINFENVTFGYDGVPIVVDASFSLHEGERVGFVGANGEGKTTVLKLLTGELTPDEGTVFRKNGMTLGYLAQTGGLTSNATVYGAMREVFAEDEQLIARLKETQDAVATATEEERRILYARIESLNKRIAARDSYHFDVKIKTVLGGMGFDGVLTQNVNTMSGGERTKLKLCSWRALSSSSWMNPPITSISRRCFGSKSTFRATAARSSWSPTTAIFWTNSQIGR